jgi:hypothetical protein
MSETPTSQEQIDLLTKRIDALEQVILELVDVAQRPWCGLPREASASPVTPPAPPVPVGEAGGVRICYPTGVPWNELELFLLDASTKHNDALFQDAAMELHTNRVAALRSPSPEPPAPDVREGQAAVWREVADWLRGHAVWNGEMVGAPEVWTAFIRRLADEADEKFAALRAPAEAVPQCLCWSGISRNDCPKCCGGYAAPKRPEDTMTIRNPPAVTIRVKLDDETEDDYQSYVDGFIDGRNATVDKLAAHAVPPGATEDQ